MENPEYQNNPLPGQLKPHYFCKIFCHMLFEFFILQHCVLTKYIYELPPCALCRCSRVAMGCFVTEVKSRHLRIYLLESISMNCAQNLIALIGSLKAKQPIASGELHRNLLQISTIRLSPPPRTSYIHPLTIQILTSL